MHHTWGRSSKVERVPNLLTTTAFSAMSWLRTWDLSAPCSLICYQICRSERSAVKIYSPPRCYRYNRRVVLRYLRCHTHRYDSLSWIIHRFALFLGVSQIHCILFLTMHAINSDDKNQNPERTRVDEVVCVTMMFYFKQTHTLVQSLKNITYNCSNS